MRVITIKSLRNEKPTQPWQVKVTRGTPLGNPYKMDKESQRDEVCDKFDKLINHYLGEIDGEIADCIYYELERLTEIYKEYGKLELFCWCYPKRCHAETIKQWVLNQPTTADKETV